MKQEIRLFVDAHIFDDSFQGSRTYIKGLYSEIIATYKDIVFFLGARNVENLKKEFGEHRNIKYIKYFSRNKFIRLTVNIPFILIRYKINLAHFQYISPLFKVCKEIITIHDVLFLDFPEFFPACYRLRNRLLFRWSAKRADYLFTVSEYSKNRISLHFKLDYSQIFVVPNCLSENFFENGRKVPDIKSKYDLYQYILYVSRFEPRKNHLLLLKAFTELGLWEKKIKLVFIGSRAIKISECENYIKQLPTDIKRSVLILSEITIDELIAFYRNCSLFVYPSLAEGFGIPPLEAAACGISVLCSNTTAMSDFKFLGERLFDPTSLEELKQKITWMLNKGPTDNSEIKDFIRLKYNWKISALKFAEILFNNQSENLRIK